MTDRRAMRRSSPPPVPRRRSRQHINPDVFSDEHALRTFDISDSSRNTDGEPIEVFRRRPSTRTPSASERESQPRWNSVRRSNYSCQNEGSNPTSRNESPSILRYSHSTASQADDGPSRNIRREPSNASSSFTPRAQSPYRGTTGPSHPYSMYNQDQDTGIGRAPSNATNLTTRAPLQSYSGPSGPSHPYVMYAQNTVSEEDFGTNSNSIQPMPAASTGPTQIYQRRQGPDGEEADDLIGPDGHTEQLPPYTQYPNDLPPKERIAIRERNTDTVERNLADSQETLNTSPTGYAEHRNLVSHNVTNPGSPERVSTSHVLSGPLVSSPADSTHARPLVDEGGNFKEVVQSRSKKRVCGRVPMWLLVLAIVAILIITIAATIGGVLRRRHWEQKIVAAQSAQVPVPTVTVTSIIDAEPLTATPSNLPSLPTGTFAMPLTSPSPSSNGCLANVAQSNAWACGDGPSVRLEISPPKGTGMPEVNIASGLLPNAIRYGAQPPQLAHAADIMIMNDKDDRGKGPAYFFQEKYNKLVIVRESNFTSNSKRWLDQNPEVSGGIEKRTRQPWSQDEDDHARPSDRPWYCYWNDTILEGFIFATQNNSDSVRTSAPLAATSTSYSASGVVSWSVSASPSLTTSSSSPSSTAEDMLEERQSALEAYPKMIKLEERRGPGSPQPYCQQMQILNTGQPAPVPGGPSGEPLVVQLDEEEPMQQNRVIYDRPNQQQRRAPFEESSMAIANRDTMTGGCRCQWHNG